MKKLILLGLLAAAGSAHALMIDDFTTGSFSQSISHVGNPGWIGSQTGSMLGGERDAGIYIESNPLGVNATIAAGSGFLVNSGGTMLSAHFGVQYDGIGDETDSSTPFNSGPGLGGVDFSADNAFQLNFIANDEDLAGYIQVYDLDGNVSQVLYTVAGGQMSPFSYTVAFSDFSGNADFSSINSITFIWSTSPSGDFALSSIESVPEPATMAILGIGAAALIRRRRSK